MFIVHKLIDLKAVNSTATVESRATIFEGLGAGSLRHSDQAKSWPQALLFLALDKYANCFLIDNDDPVAHLYQFEICRVLDLDDPT